MNVVIVEDESLAAEKLERYIQKYNADASIIIKLSSIKEAVGWFQKNIEFDVVFMDVQLTDGLSFEIFNQVTIAKPVIFTTAFDEYAIDAFKVNSIDYLLKPITFTDVSKAMVKLKAMQNLFVNQETINKVKSNLTELKTKDRFLVRLGNHIHSIKTIDILLFYAEGRTVYLVTKENKKFILDYKLEDLINVLNPSEFFRVNRTFIVSLNGVEDVIVYSSSRLKVTPKVSVEKEIIVSREKVSAFKTWFEGD